MRYIYLTIFSCLIALSSINAQTREQSIEQLTSLKEQSRQLEQSILSADKPDIDLAKAQNTNVFRILPRETYGNSGSAVRGGGAYYSFTRKSHSYDEIPQIGLEQNNLTVGFSGANYGYISDLGEVSLNNVTNELEPVKYLINYKPPTIESLARTEQKNSNGVQYNELKFQRTLAATAGHTYVLRAITYERADVLVAFTINRKDSDGSLIIFWKPIQEFEKTVLLSQTDEDLSEKIRKIFSESGFNDVTFEVNQGIVTLNGKMERVNEAMKLIGSEGSRGFVLKY
jgi:hypothetical protein